MISRCSDARNGEEKTLRASAWELRAARTAPATSSRRRTSTTCSFKFNDRAALAVIVTCDAPVVGSQSAVTRDSPGIMSCAEFRGKDGEPGSVPARSGEAGDHPGTKDVIADRDNRDRLRCLLGHFGREIAGCKNDVYFQTDQLSGKLGKLLGASLSVPEFDGDVLAVNQTKRAKSVPKRLHPG